MAKRFLFLLLLPFVAVGCNQPTATPDSRINAVCTTGMVADLVRNVGGPQVKVTQILRAGVDPHTYNASPQDLRTLSGADIVFYSGLHLEGKMTQVFEDLSHKLPSIGVANALDSTFVLKGDEHEAHDPHVWFNVQLWAKGTTPVAEALAKFDPKNAEAYRTRAQEYQSKLNQLHEECRTKIATIPAKKRVLITSHDAFRYFGKAYDIEVQGVQGISTTDEASVLRVKELVNFIVERKVKAVFVESSVNANNMKNLREGCKAKGHEVAEGGELFSDAMGEEGTPEGTYEGMIRHNVNTIVNALKD